LAKSATSASSFAKAAADKSAFGEAPLGQAAEALAEAGQAGGKVDSMDSRRGFQIASGNV
jgi:hypothetical protein